MQFKVGPVLDDQVGVIVYRSGEAAVMLPDRYDAQGGDALGPVLQPVDQDQARHEAIAQARTTGQLYIPVEIENQESWTGKGPFLLTF